MDLNFFKALSRDDAKNFLENFLEVEESAITEVVAAARANGMEMDFTLSSIPSVLCWMAKQVATVPQTPDLTLPTWIRQTASYARGLYDFDEPSKVIVLRASYYLGETFVRYYPTLAWTVGRRRTAVQSMPVVTGFSHKIEMAAMMVAENIFRDLIEGQGDSKMIEGVVAHWASMVPQDCSSKGT